MWILARWLPLARPGNAVAAPSVFHQGQRRGPLSHGDKVTAAPSTVQSGQRGPLLLSTVVRHQNGGGQSPGAVLCSTTAHHTWTRGAASVGMRTTVLCSTACLDG